MGPQLNISIFRAGMGRDRLKWDGTGWILESFSMLTSNANPAALVTAHCILITAWCRQYKNSYIRHFILVTCSMSNYQSSTCHLKCNLCGSANTNTSTQYKYPNIAEETFPIHVLLFHIFAALWCHNPSGVSTQAIGVDHLFKRKRIHRPRGLKLKNYMQGWSWNG